MTEILYVDKNKQNIAVIKVVKFHVVGHNSAETKKYHNEK